MNYTVVINGFVWIGCMIYYFLFARHWYAGPKVTVNENNSTEVDNTRCKADPAQTYVDSKEE